MDFITILQEYGPFIALVIFVIWDNRQRESKYRLREEESISENRNREQKYIEREERYIGIVESLTDSFEGIQKDVTKIKDKMGV